MKKVLGVNLLVGLIVFGLAAAVVAQEFVPGQILVKLNPGASSSLLSSVAAPGALASAQVSTSTGVMVVKLADNVAVTTAVALLSNDSAVEFAEPDWIQYATAVPNDAGSQWEWAVIDAFDAWDVTTGDSDIVVNVTDTGIDTDHEDLVGNLWTNTAEAGGVGGVDDDGNGYVDDIHGWNAVANNGSPEDDANPSHGTHCAGTIGAVTNNGIGVAGTNWTASILPCKFLNALGSGSTSDAIECVDYLIATKNAGSADIRVSSNSWGGGGSSAAMQNAIQAAVNAGILWVNAAGNNSCNNDCFCSGAYPSSYNVDGLISVAATDSSDNMASFSEYGASTVDIGAPGVSIRSTLRDGYGLLSGTSMACPHVAGAAALALAANPSLTVPQLLEVILCTGDSVSSMNGTTTTGMRLNLLGLVNAATGGTTCNDRDSDGVADYADNCPYDSNSSQSDSDNNGVGDACEPDDCGGCL